MAKKINPFIKVVNEDGVGAHTQILDQGGKAIPGITRAVITIPVDGPVTATLEAIAIHGELTAEVTELKEKIVPPPLPEEWIELVVGSPVQKWWGGRRCHYRLVRRTPLNTWGSIAEELASGWMPPMDDVPTPIVLKS